MLSEAHIANNVKRIYTMGHTQRIHRVAVGMRLNAEPTMQQCGPML